jgi:hypothetical protein
MVESTRGAAVRQGGRRPPPDNRAPTGKCLRGSYFRLPSESPLDGTAHAPVPRTMLRAIMLTLALAATDSARIPADTTRALPPRPATVPATARPPVQKDPPKPAAKPVGEPVLKRRRLPN